MRVLAKILIGVCAVLIVTLLFGPREPGNGALSFSADRLGEDLDAYLAAQEAQFDDITQGVEKRIIWADAPGSRTEFAIVYLHGFSATNAEIAPVPQLVGTAMNANVYLSRLTGHGRSGADLAQASAVDWRNDLAEAMEIGRRLGDKVIILGVSTGATLGALATVDIRVRDELAGIAMLAPNFKVNNPLAFVLDMPFARYYAPLLAGETRSWEGHNADHDTYWTTSYPTVAALPMAALMREANAIPFAEVQTPALMIFDPEDSVVLHDRTVAVAQSWGAPVEVIRVQATDADDPHKHVIAGDILSPTLTAPVAEAIAEWVRGL